MKWSYLMVSCVVLVACSKKSGPGTTVNPVLGQAGAGVVVVGAAGQAGVGTVVGAGGQVSSPMVGAAGRISPESTGSGGTPVQQGTGGMSGQGTGGTGTNPGSSGVWAMMGYDTNNTYFNPNEKTLTVDNAPMLTEKWRFMVAGYPPGSPAIAEGKVFAMATGGTYGINLNDGTMIWSRTDVSGTASIAYADGAIYAHTGAGNLWKLNAADGKTVWGPVLSYSTMDGTSSPILAGGKVLVGHSAGAIELSGGSAAGGIEAFNIADGTKAWSYATVSGSENGAMVWSTVSVDLAAGMVFAGTGNNYTVGGDNSDAIHAIDLATGMRMWKTQVRQADVWTLLGGGGEDTDFGANPILAEVGGQKIVADGDKGSSFWALDRATGNMLWSRKDLSSSHNAQNGGVLMNGAFDGKYFYVISNQPPGVALLHALDPTKMGADAWPPVMFNQVVFGAPSVANGVLVAPGGTTLNIINAMTGAMLKSFETGGTIAAGAAAIADGKIVVKSGLQYALEPTAKDNNVIICYGL